MTIEHAVGRARECAARYGYDGNVASTKKELPIDPLIPEICRHLAVERNLVLEAPPGAGKTTRVPAALLEVAKGDVLVLDSASEHTYTQVQQAIARILQRVAQA